MMLKVRSDVMAKIAQDNGWVHTSGRMAGTINTTRMAARLDVSTTTIIRAYEDGATGLKLLEKLSDLSGKTLDELVVKVAA